MVEVLAVIEYEHTLGHVTAGIVLQDDKVVEAAPIVAYMKHGKWSRARVRAYCVTKGWKVSVVHQIER